MCDSRAAFETWWGQPPQELIQCAQPDEALTMWVWQAWQAGAAAEREACAKLCDEIAKSHEKHGSEQDVYTAKSCSKDIRARGTP